MIYCVWLSSFYDRLLVLELNFWRINLKLSHTVFEGWVIVAFSCNSNHCLVKILRKLIYFLWCISVWVNWNENRLNAEKFRIWSLFNFFQSFGKFHEGIGANIWTIAESEVDKVILSLKIFARDGFSISSKKLPFSSNVSFTLGYDFFSTFSWRLFSIGSSHKLYLHDSIG
jgi:hypothetical protein